MRHRAPDVYPSRYEDRGLVRPLVGAFSIVLTSLYATVTDVLRSLPQRWVSEILAQAEAAELPGDDQGGEATARAPER